MAQAAQAIASHHPHLDPESAYVLGLLHDIGKMKIPLDILNKPGRFEAHEMEIMKQHVMRGAEVLAEAKFKDERIALSRALGACGPAGKPGVPALVAAC